MSTLVSFFARRKLRAERKRKEEQHVKDKAFADSLHLSSVVPMRERFIRVRNVAVEGNADTLHKTSLRCDVVGSCLALLQLVHDLHGVLEWLQHPSIVLLALDRYVRFLELRLAHEDEFLVPPLDVRYLWLLHVANPLAYTCDLEGAFGKRFDHCIVNDQDISLYHQVELRRTKSLWKSSFDEPYLFDDLTDELALTFDNYEAFCQASYDKLTESRPASRKRDVWMKFGINQRHVLFNCVFFLKTIPTLFQENFAELCEMIASCREQRHAKGLSKHDSSDDELSLFEGMVLGAQARAYNEFLIGVASRLENAIVHGGLQSVPVVVEAAPQSLARVFCYAHMSSPKLYRSDCRRLLGSIVYLSDSHLVDLRVEIPDFDPAEHPDELPHVLLALSSGEYPHVRERARLQEVEEEAMLLLEEQEFLWLASDSEEDNGGEGEFQMVGDDIPVRIAGQICVGRTKGEEHEQEQVEIDAGDDSRSLRDGHVSLVHADLSDASRRELPLK